MQKDWFFDNPRDHDRFRKFKEQARLDFLEYQQQKQSRRQSLDIQSIEKSHGIGIGERRELDYRNQDVSKDKQKEYFTRNNSFVRNDVLDKDYKKEFKYKDQEVMKEPQMDLNNYKPKEYQTQDSSFDRNDFYEKAKPIDKEKYTEPNYKPQELYNQRQYDVFETVKPSFNERVRESKYNQQDRLNKYQNVSQLENKETEYKPKEYLYERQNNIFGNEIQLENNRFTDSKYKPQDFLKERQKAFYENKKKEYNESKNTLFKQKKEDFESRRPEPVSNLRANPLLGIGEIMATKEKKKYDAPKSVSESYTQKDLYKKKLEEDWHSLEKFGDKDISKQYTIDYDNEINKPARRDYTNDFKLGLADKKEYRNDYMDQNEISRAPYENKSYKIQPDYQDYGAVKVKEFRDHVKPDLNQDYRDSYGYYNDAYKRKESNGPNSFKDQRDFIESDYNRINYRESNDVYERRYGSLRPKQRESTLDLLLKRNQEDNTNRYHPQRRDSDYYSKPFRNDSFYKNPSREFYSKPDHIEKPRMFDRPDYQYTDRPDYKEKLQPSSSFNRNYVSPVPRPAIRGSIPSLPPVPQSKVVHQDKYQQLAKKSEYLRQLEEQIEMKKRQDAVLNKKES